MDRCQASEDGSRSAAPSQSETRSQEYFGVLNVCYFETLEAQTIWLCWLFTLEATLMPSTLVMKMFSKKNLSWRIEVHVLPWPKRMRHPRFMTSIGHCSIVWHRARSRTISAQCTATERDLCPYACDRPHQTVFFLDFMILGCLSVFGQGSSLHICCFFLHFWTVAKMNIMVSLSYLLLFPKRVGFLSKRENLVKDNSIAPNVAGSRVLTVV